MGVAVSNWRLARAVSERGQLGVVSGTLLPVVLARRLQLGDADGALRRAAAHFPDQALVARVWQRYFVEGGKPEKAPFAAVPMPSARPSRAWVDLALLSCFCEVWLAKEGHAGPVGMNLLEKLQTSTLASLYGAMLAGVDVVLMGAGIPRAIPGALDKFAAGEAAEIALDATGAEDVSGIKLRFDPREWLAAEPGALRRPAFLAIVSSATLATSLARKSNGRVDGFVVESHAAGGHNAPPRGGGAPGTDGQPVYGPRDEPELAKFRALGLPFWLAGERATQGRVEAALAEGAAGVQVGSAFAFCEESGLAPEIKARVCELSRERAVRIFTDPEASPTGFPFKVLQLDASLSEESVYAGHVRRCDLGYLREAFVRPDGTVGYRCAAEPVGEYIAKGGKREDTEGRKCLCNGLLAAVGLGQLRGGASNVIAEPPLVTAGAETADIARFLRPGAASYSAGDVLDAICGRSARLVRTG